MIVTLDEYLQNKSAAIIRKKLIVKHADAFHGAASYIMDDDRTEVKKLDDVTTKSTKIKVRSIINTSKLFDSFYDVHIDQLWNKSLRETKDNFLVNSHDFTFSGIITDNVKAFVKQIPWHELNYDFEGNTQALVFDSIIDQKDFGYANSPGYLMRMDMQDMYRRGKVKQHSVGMRYVNVTMAVNDERYKEEHEAWEKYFPEIANKSDALDVGYFWAVTQAKHIEGSAVVRGANYATPTLHVEEKADEPPKSIHQEQPKRIPKALEFLKHYQP